MMGDWQPISTAPRDGTAILIHDPALGQRAMDVAEWLTDTDDDGDVWGDWYTSGMELNFLPVCWQPLPAPVTDDRFKDANDVRRMRYHVEESPLPNKENAK